MEEADVSESFQDDDTTSEGTNRDEEFQPKSDDDSESRTFRDIISQFGEGGDADLREEFLHKNTPSFVCFTQVELSHSSLHGIDFYFPKPEDPGIEEAFYFHKPDIVEDCIGLEVYLARCKEYEIVPIRRVKDNLTTEDLNLKYYGLTYKQIKCITDALKLNDYIKNLNLKDNHMDLRSVTNIAEMLKQNSTIASLNLRECRIGVEGAEILAEALLQNKVVEELDLSFNDIRDEGFEHLVATLTDVSSIKILNLSHNNIGEDTHLCAKALYELFEENWSLKDVDLSWNSIYDAHVIERMCKALKHNESLKRLNLAWNGIASTEAVNALAHCIAVNEGLEYLDLSYNRMTGSEMATLLKKGITHTKGLEHLNIGYNTFNADDAEIVANALVGSPTLEVMDLSNTWFNKSVSKTLRSITKAGKQLIYGGILEDFPSFESPTKRVLLHRAQYLAAHAKKKKLRKNFGHLLLGITQESMKETDFEELVKKNKVKFDEDLMTSLMNTWTTGKKVINIDQMKEDYLQLYPDTVLPPPPPPKKKKEKKKKGKGKHKGKKSKSDLQMARSRAKMFNKPIDISKLSLGKAASTTKATPTSREKIATDHATPSTQEGLDTDLKKEMSMKKLTFSQQNIAETHGTASAHDDVTLEKQASASAQDITAPKKSVSIHEGITSSKRSLVSQEGADTGKPEASQENIAKVTSTNEIVAKSKRESHVRIVEN